MSTELAPCGTKPAKARHKRRGEHCEECAPKSRAKYQCGTAQARRRHARKNETCTTCDNAKTMTRETRHAPCGTRAARQRHKKNNETCEACKPTPRLAPCGTKAAHDRHTRNGETCQTCTDRKTARAKNLEAPCGTSRARERHKRRGETCATCDATAPKLKPCGTVAAAKRHRFHGEPVCEPCRQAETTYDTNLRRGKGAKERTNISTPDLIEEIRFLVNAGEGTHRILQATGYVGRETTLRSRLTQAGQHHLAQQALNPWELAA